VSRSLSLTQVGGEEAAPRPKPFTEHSGPVFGTECSGYLKMNLGGIAAFPQSLPNPLHHHLRLQLEDRTPSPAQLDARNDRHLSATLFRLLA
jgi:hypothetical protein